MTEYIQTDRELHWLSQVIARVNRSFVEEKKDDSHTNLYFDAVNSRLLGRWINTPKGRIILSLNFNNKEFEWLDENFNILNGVSVISKNSATLQDTIGKFAGGIGLDPDKFNRPLHFEIPDYGIEYLCKNDLSYTGLKSWIFFRELANITCFDMIGYLQTESEVRIWPHHFDTGIYSMVNENLGLGFGLAMGDSIIGEPYFYLAGYAGGSPVTSSQLSELYAGKWVNTEQWEGAVLPISKISDSSIDLSLEVIRRFIMESASWYLNS